MLVRQVKGKPGLWVARRDFERLREFGQVYMPDYVLVPSEYVVVDYDPQTLTARPVGLFDPAHPDKPDGIAYLARQLNGKGRLRRNNDLFRPGDLLTLTDIARRTSRRPNTVYNWSRHPSFPKPVFVIDRGASSRPIRYFSWPEVKHWMRTQAMSIRVKDIKKRRSRAGRRRDKKGREIPRAGETRRTQAGQGTASAGVQGRADQGRL